MMSGGGNEEAVRRRREELRACYRSVFGTENGRAVLEDLMKRFGFNADGVERSSVHVGRSVEQVFHMEGCKEPVRHILYMVGVNFFNGDKKL